MIILIKQISQFLFSKLRKVKVGLKGEVKPLIELTQFHRATQKK